MARLNQNMGLGSTGISSNDYNGGAVVFNLQPYVQFSVYQKLRDQAREDSFYRYFGELGKNLTPSGMHTKDLPGLMQQKNDWQNFMMQNRDTIARPGLDHGKAYTESMGRYNSMMSYINQSKNDVKNLASLKPILDSPQKKYLLNDATMQRIHQGSLPINDPNYQPFDPSTINFNPPPFDAKQANQMRLNMTQYKPSDNPVTIPLPNHQEQTVHNYKFNQNDLNGIYTQGAMAYHTNPSFQGEIDKVKDDPEMHGTLNSLFNEHYGRDMQSPEDASAAYMLSLHPDISNKVEQPRNIPYSPWETAAAGLSREKQYYDYTESEKAAKLTEAGNQAEKFLSDREKEAKAGGAIPYVRADNGQKVNSYPVKLDPDQIKTIFGQRDVSGKHVLVPDQVRVLDNGDYLPIYYQYKEGKTATSGTGMTAVDDRYTKPVSRDAVKASIIQHKIIPTTQTTTTMPGTHTRQTSQKTTFGSGGLN